MDAEVQPPRHPVNEERVRKNLYDLNLPEISADTHLLCPLMRSMTLMKRCVYSFIAVVKSIRRREEPCRMDNSGTTSVDDEHTEIEKGKSYLVLVGNNRSWSTFLLMTQHN